MTTFIYIVFIFVCLFLIGIVLLQPGKGGGGLGAIGGGGGGGNTVFGARGATTFLQKFTVIMAASFMLLSLLLAYLSTSHSITEEAEAPSRGAAPLPTVDGTESGGDSAPAP